MEEVLFGMEHADRAHDPGLFERAHGGTLFFDEVADMPLGTQSKILRVLVDQSFTRVGGTAKVRVDLRVISSTNRDLNAEIAAGQFREELYHRLNVVPIEVPALEDRREDIPDLARHFIELFNQEQGLALRPLGDDAAAMLQTMRWPGNVRQLINVAERAVLQNRRGSGTIASLLMAESEETQPVMTTEGKPLKEYVEAFERMLIDNTMRRHKGSIVSVMDELCLPRRTLNEKMAKYGLQRADYLG